MCKIVFGWVFPRRMPTECFLFFDDQLFLSGVGLFNNEGLVLIELIFCGEFDPGSGRTLAACLTHASRTERPQLAGVLEWRTGE